ncbi:hypothetical protein ASE30_23410 [Achromobacter sp. Root83]|uniref:hypothetical protein n=1 Tax=Achromobacter sp. Root83 TaxID=1736602 RepID=UPI00070C7D8E|nr:hypothetical protein [Achromobacter sp. Root83]KRC82947.1 hypothetical protein ASE30_23410 [Achromobacter sp. Root83]
MKADVVIAALLCGVATTIGDYSNGGMRVFCARRFQPISGRFSLFPGHIFRAPVLPAGVEIQLFLLSPSAGDLGIGMAMFDATWAAEHCVALIDIFRTRRAVSPPPIGFLIILLPIKLGVLSQLRRRTDTLRPSRG